MMLITRLLPLAACLLFHSILLGQTRYYVNDDATGANDGTSWTDAFPSLQSAIITAQYGDTIWVAAGTYLPTASTNRNLSFLLKNGIRLYGGFEGTESSFMERDWQNNTTILSGDIGVPGDSTDNSYNVVFCDLADSTTVMDGFTITGGNADGQASGLSNLRPKSGGGLYIIGNNTLGGDVRPIIANCFFVNNYARFNGGGIFMWTLSTSARATPRLLNCEFRDNTAQYGGGVYKYGNGDTIESHIENCTFISNEALKSGGGYCFFDSGPNKALFFANCDFSSNLAMFDGGAIYQEAYSDSSTIVTTGCSFEGNHSEGEGSAIAILDVNFYSIGRILRVDSCDFKMNGVHMMITLRDGSLIVSNSTFEGNKGRCMEISNVNLSISNCIFKNTDNSSRSGGIVYAYNCGMDISNSIFDSNVANTGGCFYAKECSLEIYGCLFFNNSSIGGEDDDFSSTGGVFYAEDSYLNIANSEFLSNSSFYRAGVFKCNRGRLNASNCVFEDNKTDGKGGIFDALSTNIAFNNCNFLSNSSLEDSPIGRAWTFDTIHFRNCIFLNNGLNMDEPLLSMDENCIINMSNTLVDRPTCDVLAVCATSYPCNPITCGPGMLYLADPLFADTSAGDLRLLPCSPARNAGSNAIVDSLGLLYDIVGLPRIRGGVVDMGAHESPAFQATAATVLSQPCGDDDGGMVSLLLENGCPPFFLDWGGGTAISDTASAIISLPLGTHAVTVTDGRMESDTIAVTVTAAPLPTATVTATPVICATSMGGTATATATDGTAPFVYAWANGDATATADGLAAGTHVFTVTDANGCTVVDSVTVETSGGLQVGVSISPVSCHPANGAGSDGTATAQPIGGVGPFSWLWSSGDATPGIDSLAGGSYSATVTDALGCTGDVSFTMNAPTEVLASIKVMQPLCHGNLATTTATATGGTPGYTFLWSSGAATATTMLPEGHHTVTVTDMVGCVDNVSVDVVAPPLLVASAEAQPAVLCHGASDGSLNILPMGGVPPYVWGGPTDGLPAGSYTITVTDSNGCTAAASATVAEHPAIMATGTVVNASSPTAQDGSVALADVTGGTGSGYQYLWSNGDTAQHLTSVATGDYSVTVTDGQGCTGVFGFFVDFISSGAGEAGKGLFGVAIMPNPSGGAGARLVVGAVPVGTVAVRVFDGQGRLVFTGMLSADTMALPEGYAAGTYLVLLDDGAGHRASLRWVVGE